MSRFLVINDEQKILQLLFSGLSEDIGKVDFAPTLEDGIVMASGGGYDIVIIQGSPSSDFLNGLSIEQFTKKISKKIPADTLLFVTNFKGLKTKSDVAAFGASDFIISGALLKLLISENAEGAVVERKESIEKTKLKKSIVAIANIFQSLLDLEEPFQKGNIESIVECSRDVAEYLKLPHNVIDATEVAASLYDIGKIGIQNELLWKKGALDIEQQDIMKTHTIVACELLKDVPFPWDNVIPIIKHHHERYDGSGYPDSLKGREIPIGARIIAVVDSFHAMTSRRPYRKVLNVEDAFVEINKNAGIQFDPEVVEAFIEVGRKYFSDKPQKSSFKILLVDSDIKNLARLKMGLELEGYEVITAKTFGDAKNISDNQCPDLVISELILKNSEGFEFLESIKQNPEMEETVFIFLSIRNTSVDRMKAFRTGADDFIGKPYEIGELVLKIENLLKRVKKQKDLLPSVKKAGVVGNIKEFSLPDLLQILNYGLKTALVTVKNGDKEGKIYIESGKIKYISQDSFMGEDALLELFKWQEGFFTIEHGVTKDKSNVTLDSAMLILETLRRLDEIKEGTAERKGKKIISFESLKEQ